MTGGDWTGDRLMMFRLPYDLVESGWKRVEESLTGASNHYLLEPSVVP